MSHGPPPYQFLDPLTHDEMEALRESIATFGVLHPVVIDEDGNVLDGHHRVQVAAELGIEYETTVLPGLSEEQKIEQALALNLGRRHLTLEQKQRLVADLRARGLSIRWISEKTGIPKSTVARHTSGAPGGTPEYIGGRDGKRYRAASRHPYSATTVENQDISEQIRARITAHVAYLNDLVRMVPELGDGIEVSNGHLPRLPENWWKTHLLPWAERVEDPELAYGVYCLLEDATINGMKARRLIELHTEMVHQRDEHEDDNFEEEQEDVQQTV